MKQKSILVLLLAIFFSATLANAETIKIGVLAKRGPVKALKQWKATADYLTSSIKGYSFKIVPLSFDAVNPAIKNETVHFFLVNSSMFVTAKVRFRASAIATMVNSRQGKPLKTFGGVIITDVENDSINSLADLKGKRFMAVKKSSFGGWQMAYKELKDNGIYPEKDFSEFIIGGKHDNVVLAVQNADVDAGTVRSDTLERMQDEGTIDMEDFKIIGKKAHSNFPFVCSTRLYPEWPLAKVKSTPNSLVKKVVKALKNLRSTHQAAKDAKIVGWVDPLSYQPVENLQKSLRVGAYSTK